MSNEAKTNLVEYAIARQNILNNPFAMQKLENELALGGVSYEGEVIFTKADVALLFDVDERTIERYINSHKEELEKNGYRLLKGKALKELKNSQLTDINVGQLAAALSIFNFRAVLNIAMLLTESEKARLIRSKMLDIVFSVLTEKSEGNTKFINQRDADYLPAAFQEENYRKSFTDSLKNYLDMPNWKYGYCTNAIYQAVFLENADEYRKILNLSKKDKVRDTMYAEVLTVIASFEAGLAYEIEMKYQEKDGEKLSKEEFDILIERFAKHPSQAPHLNEARTKMASRDQCFRDALHHKLAHYIQSVPEADFERFLGEKSKSLQERIDENLDVFRRLKDK